MVRRENLKQKLEIFCTGLNAYVTDKIIEM